jgi:predicted phosphodiesterase
MSSTTKIVVIPDAHTPYHDKDAFDLGIRAIKAIKPDEVIVIGDFADCYSVSSHKKNPSRLSKLKQEIDESKYQLSRLKGLCGRKRFTEGNHEDRIERYLCERAPELYGLVTAKELLGCDDGEWEWYPYRSVCKIGKVSFTHEVGHFGKYAANASLAAFGGNIVFGHSHRGAIVYGGNLRGERHFALNVGWLGDIKAIDYMHISQTRDWQLGLGYLELDAKGNAWASFCPMVNRSIIIGGKHVI